MLLHPKLTSNKLETKVAVTALSCALLLTLSSARAAAAQNNGGSIPNNPGGAVTGASAANSSISSNDGAPPGSANRPSGSVSVGAESPLRGLTFDAFIRQVDKFYPKLLGADVERKMAGARRLERAGAFDPVLSHVSEYQRVQDIFEPGKAKNAVHNEGRVDLLTRSGIKVFTAFRLNPNDTKTPFVPTGKAGEYSAGVALPLMRGRGINEKTAAEQRAVIGEPLAEQVFGGNRLEILLKAAATYWDWVGAKARVDVARNLLKLAEARVEQIKLRVKNGDAPQLDVAESEQEIQRRRAAVIKAERDFQKFSLSLSVYFWDASGAPDRVPEISDVPPLAPLPSLLPESTWMRGRVLATLARPELKRIELERKQAKVDLRLAQNMMLPAVDAYLAQGADTGSQGIGAVVRGGVSISAPLRQRTARGQVQAAQLKLQKLSLDEKTEKLRIQAEVDDTVSAINTSAERYFATATEIARARDVEKGERLRFSAGDSTLFLVNQRERTTAEAELRLIDTHVDYLQALAAFKAVTCQL